MAAAVPHCTSSIGSRACGAHALGYLVVLSLLFTALAVYWCYTIFGVHYSLRIPTRLQFDEQCTAESPTASTVDSSFHRSSFINRFSVCSNKTEPDSGPSEQEEQLVYCDIFNTNPEKPVCGKKFSSTWIPYLELFNMSARQISKMTKEDDHRILKKSPVFVTAFDDSHFDAAMKCVLGSFPALYPSSTMIVYDLGLDQENIKKVQNTPSVASIRAFNFSAYPSYVRELLEYRWKPLVLAEALREFGAVFYADAHIIWTEGNMTDLLDKVQCATCGYYQSVLLGNVSHSIFATTDNRVYGYLPINNEPSRRIEMGDAGFQLIYYTKDVREYIQKWQVLCALEESCMGPKGTTIYCNFPTNRFDTFANCHRYDQSVVNILLANRNQYDQSRYCIPFPHTR